MTSLSLLISLLTNNFAIADWTPTQIKAAYECDNQFTPNRQPWQYDISFQICVAELNAENQRNATELLRFYKKA